MLTVNDAAKALKLHPETVRDMCRTNRLRFLRIGRRFRFKAEWLLEQPEPVRQTPQLDTPLRHLRALAV